MRIPPRALVLALAATAALGGRAQAQGEAPNEDWYLDFGLGGTVTNDATGAPGGDIEYDKGFLISGGIGRHLFDLGDEAGFALEVEGYYADQDVDSSGLLSVGSSSAKDLTFGAVFLNGILDWHLSKRVSLYGGVGAGYAFGIDLGSTRDSVDGNSFSEDDTSAFAWQGKAGLRYDLGGPLSWNLGYRYVQLADVSLTDSFLDESFDLETSQHAIEVGLRWGVR